MGHLHVHPHGPKDEEGGVDSGHAGLDHGLGVVMGGGVDGHVIDVELGLRQHLGGGVNDLDGYVEGPPQHIFRLQNYERAVHASNGAEI